MRAQNALTHKKKLNTAISYFIIISLGIITGLSKWVLLQKLGMMISTIFIDIFKCISLPIISLSVIVTLSQYNADQKMKSVWQRIIFYTLGTTIISASIAFILYLLIPPTNIMEIAPTATTTHDSYIHYVTNLIPASIFSPFIEHQVISALIMSIIIGIAIRHIPDTTSRQTIISFFKGAYGIFLVITSWIVKIIPIALYGFITTTVIQLKSGLNLGSLTGYLTIILLANLIQGLVVLPTFLYINNIKPFATLRAMLPALSIAFFSKSSAGSYL